MPRSVPSSQSNTKHLTSQEKTKSPSAPDTPFASPVGPLYADHIAPSNLATLQRSIGNRAVQRLLNAQPARHGLIVQPKLTVGPAQDRYEDEADHVASQVMRSISTPQGVQRASEPATIQRLPAPQVGAAGGPINEDLTTRIQSGAKGGKEVRPQIRRAVEDATGADLSGARYHDDRNSHHINAELGAKAATHQNHIFLGAGQSPHNVQLMAHELTHTVQQGAPRVQRLFGKKKPKKPTTNQEMFDSGRADTTAYFTVSAAVKTGTAARGTKSLKSILAGGSGHSWIEIQLGPAFPDLAALTADANGATIVNAMEDSTRTELAKADKRTTIGFYPDVREGAIAPASIAKQMFSNLPGHILEPEQTHFAGTERASQGYPVTDVATALDLLAYIRANRAHSYNIYRYNCTDFVNGAMASIGYSMGKISGSFGIAMPTLLYKNIYARAELGDRSAKFTPLAAKTNAKGKQYDLKHLPKKAQKKLDKKKSAAAPMLREREKRELWARAIETYTAPAFIGLKNGGMTRAGQTVFGVTGVILEHGWGEVIVDNRVDGIDLQQFEQAFGFPYPTNMPPTTDTQADAMADNPGIVAPTDMNAPGDAPSPTEQEDQPLDKDAPIPQEILEGFNDIEMDDLDNFDEQEIQIIGF